MEPGHEPLACHWSLDWVERRSLRDRHTIVYCMYLSTCSSVPGGLYPGGVHRWRHRGGAGRGGDLSNDSERLLQGSVLAEHFLSVLLLLW